jgi:hypothetical protein
MTDIWIAIIAGGAALGCIVLALHVLGRWERRRAGRWHNDYFYHGGLVQKLMTRWNSVGPRRLTDQRSRFCPTDREPIPSSPDDAAQPPSV